MLTPPLLHSASSMQHDTKSCCKSFALKSTELANIRSRVVQTLTRRLAVHTHAMRLDVAYYKQHFQMTISSIFGGDWLSLGSCFSVSQGGLSPALCFEYQTKKRPTLEYYLNDTLCVLCQTIISAKVKDNNIFKLKVSSRD